MTSPFLFADRPDDIARVRDSLDRACYSVEEVQRLLGDHVLRVDGFTFLDAGDQLALRGRTGGGSALEAMIRLFLLGGEVDLASAARVLAPLPVDAWATAGMVAVDGSSVTGCVKLLPVRVDGCDHIVAYDIKVRRLQREADFVIGVGLASMTLAAMTVRPPVGRCLDLGSGNGVQALHASRHAEAVLATDRNPRAIAFTRFTMALNRISNVVAQQGDLFEPADGDRFGLIVSNPPFVISPESAFDWRDGGFDSGGICRRIVRQAPGHLQEGGWCQLLADWPYGPDGGWKEGLAGWFEGTGCDVWVVQRDVQAADAYAARWIGYERLPPGDAEVAFDAWMDHYRRAGVAAIGHGLITMRRSRRPAPWIRIDQLTRNPAFPCGDAIRTGFDRLDWVADRVDGARLMDARLRLAEGVRLSQRSVADGGAWVVKESELALDHGLRPVLPVGPEVAGVVARCDGVRTVRSLTAARAEAAGLAVDDVARCVLRDLRALVEQGFLVPEVAE